MGLMSLPTKEKYDALKEKRKEEQEKRLQQERLVRFNQSILICVTLIDSKSYLMALFSRSRTRPYTLINVFTETQHGLHTNTSVLSFHTCYKLLNDYS